jgi:D-glycero-beta-D-manno-heptose-7-phosphate kinase
VNDINLSKNELTKIVLRYPSKKILVIGDVMLDEYIWGTVKRISSEAPVPVVEVRKRIYAVGGAGNAAANITSLGGQAKLGGIIGEDQQALILLKELNKLSIKSRGILIDKNFPTITKTRIIAHEQQVVRLDIESCKNIETDLEDKLLSWAERSMYSVQACIISDYGKNVISVRIAQSVIKMAQNLNIPVVVDPKGLDYKKYIGATVITPNIQEAERALNCEINNEADLNKAGIKLNRLLAGCAVLITRGSAGMSLFIDGDKAIDISTIAKRLYDVTGAGDTVVSTLSMSLAVGATLEQAAFLANQAAGLVVEKLGTATVSGNELANSLN